MKIEDLKNKKILILGFGKEGSDTLQFLRVKFPGKKIGVADKNKNIDLKKDKFINFHLGENYLDYIKNYEVIIKSPGISINLINPYISKNQIITSQADLFLSNTKGLVIGITGTKGKSTTSTLIYKILKLKKIKVFLIGNIGKPALSYLLKDKPDKVYVYELSSFQLETINKPPQIAIILNFFKDHLDQHKNINEYFNAKKKITISQNENDFLIFNSKDSEVKKMVLRSNAQKIPFDPNKNKLELKNFLNIYTEPLFIIAKMFGIKKDEVIAEIKKFKPLTHRLEYVGKYKEITFYNDSAATIPEATISAIKKLGKDLDSIIVGGVDKGFDLKELSKEIINSNIKNVILFPETGKKIKNEIIKSKKKINIFESDNMKKAVEICFRETKKGKTCLLSPAASSFNMFTNYKQRGELFKKYVKK